MQPAALLLRAPMGELRDVSPSVSLLKSPLGHPDGARYCVLKCPSEALIVRVAGAVAGRGNRHFRWISAAVNNLLRFKKAESCNFLI